MLMLFVTVSKTRWQHKQGTNNKSNITTAMSYRNGSYQANDERGSNKSKEVYTSNTITYAITASRDNRYRDWS